MTSVMLQTPTSDALAEFLAQGREIAIQSNKPVLTSFSHRLHDDIDCLSLFANIGKSNGYRAFWGRPAQDFWLVGKGNAAGLVFNGSQAMDEAVQAYRSLLENALIEAPDIPGTGPVCMGGFRFDPQAPKDADWSDFSDAGMVLPQFLFTRSVSAFWLTVNAIIESDTDVAMRAKELVTELQNLDTDPLDGNYQPEIKKVTQDYLPQYCEYVRSALRNIEEGLLAKVVLARRKILYAEEPFSIDSAIKQLTTNYPDCVIFAFDNGKSIFFGATPESLASVSNGILNLTCLAGSTARGATPEEDYEFERQLFESQKERWEHNAVVATVTESLQDLCRELNWDSELNVLKLRNVQHLLTSVTANLHSGNNIFDVVKKLHPTPAVAGVPTSEAMSFIRQNEGDRGWYAAPVGCIDHMGGGEFVVAIRSALLLDKRAILYAGAGIVKGSDPEQEFQETELKFQPILSALHGRNNVI